MKLLYIAVLAAFSAQSWGIGFPHFEDISRGFAAEGLAEASAWEAKKAENGRGYWQAKISNRLYIVNSDGVSGMLIVESGSGAQLAALLAFQDCVSIAKATIPTISDEQIEKAYSVVLSASQTDLSVSDYISGYRFESKLTTIGGAEVLSCSVKK